MTKEIWEENLLLRVYKPFIVSETLLFDIEKCFLRVHVASTRLFLSLNFWAFLYNTNTT